jgi:hypothetical protein
MIQEQIVLAMNAMMLGNALTALATLASTCAGKMWQLTTVSSGGLCSKHGHPSMAAYALEVTASRHCMNHHFTHSVVAYSQCLTQTERHHGQYL